MICLWYVFACLSVSLQYRRKRFHASSLSIPHLFLFFYVSLHFLLFSLPTCIADLLRSEDWADVRSLTMCSSSLYLLISAIRRVEGLNTSSTYSLLLMCISSVSTNFFYWEGARVEHFSTCSFFSADLHLFSTTFFAGVADV